MTVVVAVVAVVALLATYLTWVAGRLDQLSTRAAAAWSALDAQLVRRAAAASDLAADRVADAARSGQEPPAGLVALATAAGRARDAAPADRELAENALTRAARSAVALVSVAGVDPGDLTTGRLVEDLASATTRAAYARQFYNDAVTDSRRLRRRRLPRLLSVARRDAPPTYFEIVDPSLAPVPATV